MDDALSQLAGLAAPPAAATDTAAHLAALKESVAATILAWWNANIAVSPVSAAPGALAWLKAALPALEADLVVDPPVDYPVIFQAWLEAKINNSPVSRDVDAYTHLTSRLPALANALAAAAA